MKQDAEFNDSGLSPSEQEAASWALRLANGLTPAEERELEQWLGKTAGHPELLAEMTQTSALLDGLKFRTPAVASPESQAAPRRRRKRFAVASSLAAAVALAFLGWQYQAHRYDTHNDAVATRVGELKRLSLPDGSEVLLNTNTSIEVSFRENERRIRLLGGEAYFEVAKNPARPFVVQAGRLAVRAVGTAFDVRLKTDALSVLVTEGKVRVHSAENDHARSPLAPETPGQTAAPDGPLLSAGHLGRVFLDADRAPEPASLVISEIESRLMHNALAWHEGRLEFSDTPLSEVVAEFNRYNERKIVISDPALAEQRFGGAFASHEVEPFLELLEQSFGVVVDTRGAETRIRRSK